MTEVPLARLLLFVAAVLAGLALLRAPATASAPLISLSLATPHLSVSVAL